MGVGHLNIGTGIGGADVFNSSPIIQQYGQLLTQRKAKQDAENASLAQTLAKGYDPSSLRNDADRQSYLKQYSDIKQAAIDSHNEKDALKKAIGLANVRQQLTDLGTFAENSKKQGLQEQAWATHYMAQPQEWDDNAINAYRKSKDAALGTPDVVNDFTTLQRRVDPTKIANLIKGHSELMLKNSPITYVNGTIGPEQTIEGKKQRQVTQNRIIPFADALESTLHLASVDKDYQKYLSDNYKDIQGDNELTTRALRVKQDLINKGYGNGFMDKPLIRTVTANAPPQPDRYYDHLRARLAAEGGAGGVGAPQDLSIPYNDGKSHVNTKGYVPVNSAVVNMAGSPSYNLTTGTKDAETLSSGDYQLVGVANVPFVKGDKLKLNGAIAQPNWVATHPNETEYKPMVHVQVKDPETNEIENKLVPLDRLPKNLPKATLKALGGFKPISASAQPTEYKIGGKAYKPDAVQKAAKASGMTIDEYLKEVNGK